MNDTINIFDQLKKPTAFKNPVTEPDGFNINLQASDFEDAPYIPEQSILDTGFLPADSALNNGASAMPPPPPERVFDPDFTTDIVVDTIDTLQFSLFLALQTRKQKEIRFKNREEYVEAISLNYLTDGEIDKLENPEDKRLLVQKLKAYQAAMSKINDKTSFTPDELDRLKKPVRQLVKQHNFDIPPGLAFVLVFADIISNRYVDLIMD